MSTTEITTQNESETRALGQFAGSIIEPGTILALSGTLGAGKTFLVQSIAEGLGIEREWVVSPTFTMIQTYHGRLPLVHIDAYRIADDDEYHELGIDELMEEPNHVVAMEWADRFADLLPTDRVSINIEIDDAGRKFTLEGHGAIGPATRFVAEISRRFSVT